MSSIPFRTSREDCKIAVTKVDGLSLSGEFSQPSTHHRFELEVTYLNGSDARFSVSAGGEEGLPANMLPEALRSFHVQFASEYSQVTFRFKRHPDMDFSVAADGSVAAAPTAADEPADLQVYFDVSDLVYYIGHHDNLTGIQRVQACVLLGLIEAAPEQARGYISFDNRTRDFIALEPDYFEALLRDLSLPAASRTVEFDPLDARDGILPESSPLSSKLVATPKQRTFIYLLGAAWVNRDYFHRILDLKRSYDAQFCMTIHDLIPIYARETCDQGTAIVFEEFLRRSFQFTDCYYTVSEYTAYDLIRFAKSIGIDNVPVSVVENGHTLDAGLGSERHPSLQGVAAQVGRSPFVLFVSTVEGRKNHSFIFDVWAELARTMPTIPTLVCVGRFGWRAEQFLEKMLVTGNLSNRIKVLSDISDTELEALYDNCLFTVYPSAYEGWGLPVGESLSRGKLCVVSDRSSLPEVAGSHGIYIDPDDVADAARKVRKLVEDQAYRSGLEQRLREDFVPRTWDVVAMELLGKLAELPAQASRSFPLLTLGTEYKLTQLPSRNVSSLGVDMLRTITDSRRGPLTNQICRDEDFLAAQAMRSGNDWYEPEDWGTWSRFPGARKQFYVRPMPGVTEVVIYERIRIVKALVGQVLRVAVNGGAQQEFRLDSDRLTIRLACPLELDAEGVAEVDLRFGLSRISSEHLAELDTIDRRRLGLGFESTYILDQSDLAARLQLLERMMFEAEGLAAAAKMLRGGSSARTGGSRGQQAATTSLSAGERVAFTPYAETRLGAPVEQLLLDGWGTVEAGGPWSLAESATLGFSVASPADGMQMLWMNVGCLAAPDRPVELSILVNGTVLGSVQIVDRQVQRLQYMLDPQDCPDGKTFVITFQCDRLVSPTRFGMHEDSRKLGVRLQSCGISAMPALSPGREYPVAAGNEAGSIFASGWYEPEGRGVWTGQGPARIFAPLALGRHAEQTHVQVTVKVRPFGATLLRPSKVDVKAQGRVVETWTFRHRREVTRQALLPISIINGRPFLDLALVCRSPLSPFEAGAGDDPRKLGLFVSSISLK